VREYILRNIVTSLINVNYKIYIMD